MPIPVRRAHQCKRLAGLAAAGYKSDANAVTEASHGVLKLSVMGSTVFELVLAVAKNDVIGRGEGLPWHLPADLRHFKTVTMGWPILMGRKTFASIGRALPGRRNLILTRRRGFHADGCEVIDSIGAALASAADLAKIMVIGGAEVFDQCIPQATRIHLTMVHAEVEGDTRFAGWRDPTFIETAREDHAADAQHPFAYSFITLDRMTAA
jgi:dihydrofolate reductase